MLDVASFPGIRPTDIQEPAEWLAHYSEATRPRTVKTAGMFKEALDPRLVALLAGGGIGGAAGLLGDLARDEDERDPLASGLSGLAAGGALGLGAGLMTNPISLQDVLNFGKAKPADGANQDAAGAAAEPPEAGQAGAAPAPGAVAGPAAAPGQPPIVEGDTGNPDPRHVEGMRESQHTAQDKPEMSATEAALKARFGWPTRNGDTGRSGGSALLMGGGGALGAEALMNRFLSPLEMSRGAAMVAANGGTVPTAPKSRNPVKNPTAPKSRNPVKNPTVDPDQAPIQFELAKHIAGTGDGVIDTGRTGWRRAMALNDTLGRNTFGLNRSLATPGQVTRPTSDFGSRPEVEKMLGLGTFAQPTTAGAPPVVPVPKLRKAQLGLESLRRLGAMPKTRWAGRGAGLALGLVPLYANRNRDAGISQQLIQDSVSQNQNPAVINPPAGGKKP